MKQTKLCFLCEIGVLRNNINIFSPLLYPVVVFKKDNNNYYILDVVNYSARLLLVDSNKNIINKIERFCYKGKEAAICARMTRYIGDNKFISLDLATKRVVIFNDTGLILWSFGLNIKEDYDPVAVNLDSNNNILIVDKMSKSIFMINFHKELVNIIKLEDKYVLEPTSIESTRNETFLITDADLNAIFEFDNKGKKIWYFEKYKNNKFNQQLSCPQHACQLNQGETIITDKFNNKIIVTNSEKNVIWNSNNIFNREDSLCYPMWAIATADNTMIIADTGNNRILEVNKDIILWEYGNKIIKKRYLSRPRSVQKIGNNLLIADTAHNRVILCKENNELIWEIKSADNMSLFWPRWAHYHKNYGYIFTDSRNNRILLYNENLVLNKCIYGYNYEGRYFKFNDPHQAERLNNGKILICDTQNDRIVVLDQKGDITICVYGYKGDYNLKDPHYARMNKYNEMVIADTANNRLLIIDENGKIEYIIDSLIYNNQVINIDKPRFCRFYNDEHIQYADNTVGTIFTIKRSKEIIDCLHFNNSLISNAIKFTRCIYFDNDTYYISDIENDSIIKAIVY